MARDTKSSTRPIHPVWDGFDPTILYELGNGSTHQECRRGSGSSNIRSTSPYYFRSCPWPLNSMSSSCTVLLHTRSLHDTLLIKDLTCSINLPENSEDGSTDGGSPSPSQLGLGEQFEMVAGGVLISDANTSTDPISDLTHPSFPRKRFSVWSFEVHTLAYLSTPKTKSYLDYMPLGPYYLSVRQTLVVVRYC